MKIKSCPEAMRCIDMAITCLILANRQRLWTMGRYKDTRSAARYISRALRNLGAIAEVRR